MSFGSGSAAHPPPSRLTGHLRERNRIADRDLVARHVDQPFLVELVQVAGHNLAHRPDRVGELLAARVQGKGRTWSP
jgi:hypothetical protein